MWFCGCLIYHDLPDFVLFWSDSYLIQHSVCLINLFCVRSSFAVYIRSGAIISDFIFTAYAVGCISA